jgi:membrane protein required for colicin V production
MLIGKIILATLISIFGRHVESVVKSSAEQIEKITQQKTFYHTFNEQLDHLYQSIWAAWNLLSAMNMVDYGIIVIILISIVISVCRGFIQEALSLCTWFAAVFLSIAYGHQISFLLLHWIHHPSTRLVVGIGIVFLATLIIGALLNSLITHGVKQLHHLTWINRVLGFCFGLIRGLLLTTFLIVMMRLTAINQNPWWQQSIIIPKLGIVSQTLERHVPLAIQSILQQNPNLNKNSPKQSKKTMHHTKTSHL